MGQKYPLGQTVVPSSSPPTQYFPAVQGVQSVKGSLLPVAFTVLKVPAGQGSFLYAPIGRSEALQVVPAAQTA